MGNNKNIPTAISLKSRKLFSLNKKLVLLFAGLLIVSFLVNGLLSFATARNAIAEQVKAMILSIKPMTLHKSATKKLTAFLKRLRELHIAWRFWVRLSMTTQKFMQWSN